MPKTPSENEEMPLPGTWLQFQIRMAAAGGLLASTALILCLLLHPLLFGSLLA